MTLLGALFAFGQSPAVPAHLIAGSISIDRPACRGPVAHGNGIRIQECTINRTRRIDRMTTFARAIAALGLVCLASRADTKSREEVVQAPIGRLAVRHPWLTIGAMAIGALMFAVILVISGVVPGSKASSGHCQLRHADGAARGRRRGPRSSGPTCHDKRARARGRTRRFRRAPPDATPAHARPTRPRVRPSTRESAQRRAASCGPDRRLFLLSQSASSGAATATTADVHGHVRRKDCMFVCGTTSNVHVMSPLIGAGGFGSPGLT